jgi:hypothetical protein
MLSAQASAHLENRELSPAEARLLRSCRCFPAPDWVFILDDGRALAWFGEGRVFIGIVRRRPIIEYLARLLDSTGPATRQRALRRAAAR